MTLDEHGGASFPRQGILPWFAGTATYNRGAGPHCCPNTGRQNLPGGSACRSARVQATDTVRVGGFLRHRAGFFRSKMKARFILKTHRRGRGGDHFNKKCPGEEGCHYEQCCHHGTVPSTDGATRILGRLTKDLRWLCPISRLVPCLLKSSGFDSGRSSTSMPGLVKFSRRKTVASGDP